MYIIEKPQRFPAKACRGDSWSHNAVVADSIAVPFTTWKRFQKHDGSRFWWLYTTMSGWSKEASVYSHLSTYTSQMLTYSILFYSDKHRRRKKEIWKFAVHLDAWCYSLFVSER